MANYEVKLKDGNDVLYPQAMVGGIDVNNILFDSGGRGTDTYTYLATQDCYCILQSEDYNATYRTEVYIDDLKVYDTNYVNSSNFLSFEFPLKKEQVLKYYSYRSSLKVFGIKH